MPQRIRELCARFDGGPEITEDADIRYQLLYGTAGTVCAGMDVSVFYVAVFLTDDYDSSIWESNYQDYRKFIEQAGGKPTKNDGAGASSHLLTVGGRSLVSIYEYFRCQHVHPPKLSLVVAAFHRVRCVRWLRCGSAYGYARADRNRGGAHHPPIAGAHPHQHRLAGAQPRGAGGALPTPTRRPGPGQALSLVQALG